MTRSISLILAGIFVQGCVGVATLRTKEETIKKPVIWNQPSIYGVRSEPMSTTNSAFTAAWLRVHWGEPSSIQSNSINSNEKFWTYKFGRRLNGIVPMFIVPIPLIVPVGKEKIIFSLENGTIVSARCIHEQSFEAVAGWYWYGPCGPSWGIFRRSSP